MRVIKRKNSYYLQHSYRVKGNVVTKEQYLGLKIPENIDQRKESLLRSARQEAFYTVFDDIKKAFQKEWKRYPPSAREKAIQQLAVNFTYDTNAIEGSTITRAETREIVENNISPNKPLNDVIEAKAHAKLFMKLINTSIPLTKKTILKWHKELFSQTKPDIAGKIRDYLVKVGDYRAPDWQDLLTLLNDYFAYVKTSSKLHPVEQAARLHYRFEKIHPFGDGNGRIGRLISNQILWHKGYPMLIIEYKKRKSYYKALGKTEEQFVQYFIRRYLASHKKYLK